MELAQSWEGHSNCPPHLGNWIHKTFVNFSFLLCSILVCISICGSIPYLDFKHLTRMVATQFMPGVAPHMNMMQTRDERQEFPEVIVLVAIIVLRSYDLMLF